MRNILKYSGDHKQKCCEHFVLIATVFSKICDYKNITFCLSKYDVKLGYNNIKGNLQNY